MRYLFTLFILSLGAFQCVSKGYAAELVIPPLTPQRLEVLTQASGGVILDAYRAASVRKLNAETACLEWTKRDLTTGLCQSADDFEACLFADIDLCVAGKKKPTDER